MTNARLYDGFHGKTVISIIRCCEGLKLLLKGRSGHFYSMSQLQFSIHRFQCGRGDRRHGMTQKSDRLMPSLVPTYVSRITAYTQWKW